MSEAATTEQGGMTGLRRRRHVAARIMVAAASMMGFSVGAAPGVASAYTPQNCGTQLVETLSRSTRLTVYTAPGTCRMAASVKCQWNGTFFESVWRHSGSINSGTVSSTCPSDATAAYAWGHQEGINW
ncbi:MAG: hypothetical protein FGM29_08380 [Actinobacteria bacterium]|nr:hypothetical protein [Actinomycetota bacterium]